MKAQDFLRNGAELLEERGKQYDQPGGERSMGKTVRAFNAITGRDLTEPEGWLLLQVLKDVRQWQNPDKYHADSAEDCVSYAALKAEALIRHANSKIDFAGFPPLDENGAAIEPAAAMEDDSPRMQAIGQNGELGEEIYPALDGWIKWEGGECPVDRATKVEVKFPYNTTDIDKAGSFGWDFTGTSYSIIAYKIHKEA